MANELNSIAGKYISPLLCQFEKWIINEAECSCLCCMRFAQRMSAYKFFVDSEKLFIPSLRLTTESTPERAGFSKAEQLTVYEETEFVSNEPNIMKRQKFSAFCKSV